MTALPPVFLIGAEILLRELMERMGHSGTRLALIYQHSATERQRAIADAVGKAAKAALRKAKTPKPDGTASGT